MSVVQKISGEMTSGNGVYGANESSSHQLASDGSGPQVVTEMSLEFMNSDGETFTVKFSVPRSDDSLGRLFPVTAPTLTRYKLTVETV